MSNLALKPKGRPQPKGAAHSPSPLVCVATATNREDESGNEDSCQVAENRALRLKAAIVADGLGSYEHAHLASEFVTTHIKDQIEGFSADEDIDFKEIFAKAKSQLIHFVEDFERERGTPVDREASFGTTLILALEDEERVRMAYVGNGSIWHIRGNFNHFHETKYLPWNGLNYLNPHSVQNERGKEALYRLISASDDMEEAVPTVLEVQKDNLSFGDIFMISTDGIYSFDQVPVGKVKDGSVWISGERTMSLFYEHLNEYFSSADPSSESLEQTLQAYFDSLKADGLLGDDAAVGVMVTRKAMEYQTKRQKHKSQRAL